MFVCSEGLLHIGDINLPAKLWLEISGFMSQMSYEYEERMLRENIVRKESEIVIGVLSEHLKRQATSDDILRTEKTFIPRYEDGHTAYHLYYWPPPGEFESSTAVSLGRMHIYYQEPNLMRVFWQQRYIKINFQKQPHEESTKD